MVDVGVIVVVVVSVVVVVVVVCSRWRRVTENAFELELERWCTRTTHTPWSFGFLRVGAIVV